MDVRLSRVPKHRIPSTSKTCLPACLGVELVQISVNTTTADISLFVYQSIYLFSSSLFLYHEVSTSLDELQASLLSYHFPFLVYIDYFNSHSLTEGQSTCVDANPAERRLSSPPASAMFGEGRSELTFSFSSSLLFSSESKGSPEAGESFSNRERRSERNRSIVFVQFHLRSSDRLIVASKALVSSFMLPPRRSFISSSLINNFDE